MICEARTDFCCKVEITMAYTSISNTKTSLDCLLICRQPVAAFGTQSKTHRMPEKLVGKNLQVCLTVEIITCRVFELKALKDNLPFVMITMLAVVAVKIY